MRCLFDQLSTYKSSDLLWFSDTVGRVGVAGLEEALASIDLSAWQYKRVAIGALPVLEFVSALALLDGLAQAIILLPLEDDQPTRKARLAQAEIDIVLEGNGFDFTNKLALLGAPNVCRKQSPVSDRPEAIQTGEQ
jgi:hypothetical protein